MTKISLDGDSGADAYEKDYFFIAETIPNIEDFLKSRGCSEAEIQKVKEFLKRSGAKLLQTKK
ncbi:MAG: hypothetical protein N2253_09210 [Bacteroidia bacterium]|nr:hypothetical protein [Bacteroidia bacterium]